MFLKFKYGVVRQAQIAWLAGAVACCAITSCKGHNSVFGPPSPEKIASEYFSALASNPPGDAFWQYDARFVEQLTSIEANVPESMWAQKKDALRQQWQAEMNSGGIDAQEIRGAGPCWQLIRPGDSAKVIETRDEAGPASDASSPGAWRVFVQVTYPQSVAPAFWTSSGSRLLKHGTVIASERQEGGADKKGKTFIVDDCSFSPDTVAFWPVPPVTNDAALALAKASMPQDMQYETITLVASPAIWANPGPFHGDWKLFTDFTARLRSFYGAHQFSVNGFTISPGFYYTTGDVQPPTSWNQYGVGNGAYRLNETTNVQIVNIESTDNHAVARGQVSYSGCTVPCSFLEDLRKQSDLGGYVVGNYSSVEAPRQVGVTISYQWDPRSGWTATGFQRSQ